MESGGQHDPNGRGDRCGHPFRLSRCRGFIGSGYAFARCLAKVPQGRISPWRRCSLPLQWIVEKVVAGLGIKVCEYSVACSPQVEAL